MKKLLIIGLCLGLLGCAHLSKKQVIPFEELKFGMTKLQMTDLMGEPDAIEIYKKSDQTRMEFYIYPRKYQSSQIKVPVCLVDNRVVGWGKSYYEDHVSQDDIRIK